MRELETDADKIRWAQKRLSMRKKQHARYHMNLNRCCFLLSTTVTSSKPVEYQKPSQAFDNPKMSKSTDSSRVISISLNINKDLNTSGIFCLF